MATLDLGTASSDSAAWDWIAALSRGEACDLKIPARTPGTLSGLVPSFRFIQRTMELAAAANKALSGEREVAQVVSRGLEDAFTTGALRACLREGCAVIFDVRDHVEFERRDLGTGWCPICKDRYEINASYERAKFVWSGGDTPPAAAAPAAPAAPPAVGPWF